MSKPIEELRAMATQILESGETNVALNVWGNNVKDLLQELSIYQIELEHQNKELDRSEKDLAVSQAEYVDLFENAPISYVVINNEGRIQKVNGTFVLFFMPLTAQSTTPVGLPFNNFVCPEYKKTFDIFCGLLAKKGPAAPIEIKIFDRLNRSHYVQIIAGERTSVTTTYRLAIVDIAVQKSLEAQLVAAREKAEEEDRQKSVFLTNVSHEFRTPLTTLLGFADELCRTEGVSDKMRESIDVIRSSGNMLMQLVDEVLDLSTLQGGIVSLRKTDTDLPRICNEITLLLQSKNQNKNILFRNEIRDVPILLGDPVRLRQIVFSILDHAASNAVDGTIQVQGRFEQQERVLHEGTLILDFSGENIFSGESSLQMDFQARSKTLNCAGLGLFLARQIVKAMGGHLIWVHPFNALRVELPFKVSSHRTSVPVPAPAVLPVTGKTCLLVDDVVMNLRVLSAMVRRLGFTPTLASSGKEALQQLSENHFDVLLTDLWMPEMNGEELAVMIRQNPDYDEMPIYAVTADIERTGNFDMSFFKDTIIKPVSFGKLSILTADAAVSAQSSQ